MGKAPREKKVSVNEARGHEGRPEKELKPSQESPSKSSLQTPASIIKFIPIVILVLVSFGVYFNALFCDFVYDDKVQILENPWIKNIGNIPAIFSRSVWSFQSDMPSNYYRPLMHIVYMINYHLFGLKPWGFHLVNILFHCGVTVLVFLVIRRLLPDPRTSVSAAYLSPPFIAAILFASHPIHTEAVTWIAGLPDVAFTFFYLLSFYLYVLFRDGFKRGYILSLLSFSVATIFKEPALTLPVLLVAYDYLLKKSDENILAGLRIYIPYAAVSGVYLLVRCLALRSFVPLESYAALSTYQSIINVFPLFSDYIASLLWPVGLNLWHSFHPASSLFEAKVLISLVVAVLSFIVAVATYRKNRLLFFSLLLVVVPLLPVFYIKAISGKPFAERYLYLPSVGFVFTVAICLAWARERLPRAANVTTIVFIVIAGLYTVGTMTRNNVWLNDLTLWSDTVMKSPDSADAHFDLGNEYKSQGQLDKAVIEQQAALRLKPDFSDAHNSLGVAYKSLGQLDKAVAEFQAAASGSAEAHINLGSVYLSQGQLDKAVAEFQVALQLRPDYFDAHIDLGSAYASQGQLDKAVAEFQEALRLKPDHAKAHYNLGLAYTLQRQLDKAISELQEALLLKPDYNDARRLLNNIVTRRH
jgi:tetratricopeptide (TPR) repeat protein